VHWIHLIIHILKRIFKARAGKAETYIYYIKLNFLDACVFALRFPAITFFSAYKPVPVIWLSLQILPIQFSVILP